LSSDPLELTNLYDNPEQATRIKDMTVRMQDWQARVGDDLDLISNSH